MGIVSYFKKIFNKNVEVDEMFDSEFVHLYSKSLATFEIGYNIVVRPGFNAVFVVRNKVTDVLAPGKYRIGLESLPLTFRRLKIDRIKKNGKAASKFKADIYFVNINIIKGLAFDSTYAYMKKTKDIGQVTAYSEGVYDTQVTDAGDLVSFLILERAYITNKQSIQILGTYVGNVINKMLEKSNLTVVDIFKNPAQAEQLLNESINKRLESIGIQISNINLKCFNISSRAKQKIDSSIEEQKQFVQEYKEFSKDDSPTIEIDPQNFVVENKVEELTTEFTPQEYTVEQVANTKEHLHENSSNIDIPSPNVTFDISSDEIAKKVCPNCDKQINANSKFCQYCGFKLDEL